MILNYKAVQNEKGLVDLYVEGVENRVHETFIQGELKKYFNDDIGFNLLFVKAFKREKKKSQYFESKISWWDSEYMPDRLIGLLFVA